MEEDDDYDEELELFHGRYQSSYLVVDKTFPQNVPPDDESEIDEDSNFSPSDQPKYEDLNGDHEPERPAQTYEMGISTASAFLTQRDESKPEVSKKEELPPAPNTANDEESSQRSSLQERSKKPSSVSSKQMNQGHQSNPALSKSASERKSMAHWVEEEKEEFKRQLSVHGKNWKRIAQVIKNKTEKQIRNFYQNYKKKLNLEDLLPSNERGRGKKLENVGSGLKRTRSFTRSISPFKRGRKKRKVISSDNSSDKSLSNIEEEKEEAEYKRKPSSSHSSSSSSKPQKKRVRKGKKVMSESSSGSESSSSSQSDEGSEGSSYSSRNSESEASEESRGKKKSPKYDTGSDLD